MPLDASVMAAVDTSQQATGHAYDPARTPSGSRPGPRWFVVSTYPQAERRALDHLQQQGYQAYLPLCTIRRRDRVLRTLFHPVEAPLFPSYAFVSFDPQHDPWRPIVNTLGVYALLRRPDGIPNPVARGAVEALRAAQELLRTPTTQETLYRPGAACSAILGGGVKVDGIVLAVIGQKTTLSAIMFGELREITVDIANLRLRDE